jgi:TorA maturation chaperone TorD
MTQHTHNFVENYKGFVGFGFDRETDENTVIFYLQKFADDALMEKLRTSLTNSELENLFNLMSSLLKKHLTEKEYHKLFLKDTEPDKHEGCLPYAQGL